MSAETRVWNGYRWCDVVKRVWNGHRWANTTTRVANSSGQFPQ